MAAARGRKSQSRRKSPMQINYSRSIKVCKIIQILFSLILLGLVMFESSPCIRSICVIYQEQKQREYCFRAEPGKKCAPSASHLLAVGDYFKEKCGKDITGSEHEHLLTLLKKVHMDTCYLPPIGLAILFLVSLFSVLIYSFQALILYLTSNIQRACLEGCSVFFCVLWLISLIGMLYTDAAQMPNYLQPIKFFSSYAANQKAFNKDSHMNDERFALEWTRGYFEVNIDQTIAKTSIAIYTFLVATIAGTFTEMCLACRSANASRSGKREPNYAEIFV